MLENMEWKWNKEALGLFIVSMALAVLYTNPFVLAFPFLLVSLPTTLFLLLLIILPGIMAVAAFRAIRPTKAKRQKGSGLLMATGIISVVTFLIPIFVLIIFWAKTGGALF